MNIDFEKIRWGLPGEHIEPLSLDLSLPSYIIISQFKEILQSIKHQEKIKTVIIYGSTKILLLVVLFNDKCHMKCLV